MSYSNYETALNIKKVINKHFIGKEELVDHLLICFFAGGHVLLEDVPGVGKTTLSKIFASVCGLSFGRITFTPDTMPSDVTGVTIYNMKTGEFEWKNGVIVNQFILADEINRTPPKTQSALLESMAEKQITADGKTIILPQPFMVMATQNPIEYLGTYPLPEAQMDRFMMQLSIGYPETEDEISMAKLFLNNDILNNIEKICDPMQILSIQKEVNEVHIEENVLGYMQNLIALTRENNQISLGASPRAFLALIKACQAKAFLENRDFVKPDDVKKMFIPVVKHRIVLNIEAKRQKMDLEKILMQIVVKARVPDEKK